MSTAEPATNASGVRIVRYAPALRDAFKTLNEAWITELFQLEPADRKVLDAPEAVILAGGGEILFAQQGTEAVGVCALIWRDTETIELAKMAVTRRSQGQGIGHRLGLAAVAWARAAGARRMFLESNTKLTAALALYRKLGFVEVSRCSSDYVRCDIRMELRLDGSE